MSMASTIPSMRLSCSATSSSSTTAFRRVISKKPSSTVIRSSQAEGPLRRPVAPLREPTPPLKPVPPTPPSSSSPILSPPPSPSPPTKPATAGTVPDSQVPATVTIEFQRRMAKELQEYFREKKVEEANEGPAFGFLGKNEIANGRWAMFGFAVGLLTEYATGSDFVDQFQGASKVKNFVFYQVNAEWLITE